MLHSFPTRRSSDLDKASKSDVISQLNATLKFDLAEYFPVSARTGDGLDALIEMILLVADLQELKANPDRPAIGTIVEAQLDKNRGPVANAAVVGVDAGVVRLVVAVPVHRNMFMTGDAPSSGVVMFALSRDPAIAVAWALAASGSPGTPPRP